MLEIHEPRRGDLSPPSFSELVLPSKFGRLALGRGAELSIWVTVVPRGIDEAGLLGSGSVTTRESVLGSSFSLPDLSGAGDCGIRGDGEKTSLGGAAGDEGARDLVIPSE